VHRRHPLVWIEAGEQLFGFLTLKRYRSQLPIAVPGQQERQRGSAEAAVVVVEDGCTGHGYDGSGAARDGSD
jgi:hypothetical protein